jgi:tRNA threonylcarbamoyladenosine biosynthesis protein TsaB
LRILSVDTSTISASVAIMEDNTLLSEYFINNKKTHSQKIVPMINEILQNMGMKPDDIDLFAAITGPGSFTGLRIGVTTVKTMAYALKKPARGVTTLDALSANIPICDAIICPIIDARNNQVYTALYQWNNGKRERITDYMGIDVDELVQKVRETIKEENRKVFILGDGVKIHRDKFINELKDACLFPPDNLMLQKASSAAEIVMNEIKEFNGLEELDEAKLLDEINKLVPFYLRKSQAERLYNNAR